jgi:cyclopropane fatty-acyl-phospholipid synthase-like methyltransferase
MASCCHSCGAAALEHFYRVDAIPVHSVLLMASREMALGYPKRDLLLGFCPICGFIQNSLFDPCGHEYSTRYEETQGFSEHFNQFAKGLAEHLVESYDLRGKRVLEIGCGKGEFLQLICELGNNQGVGVDPSYVPERMPASSHVGFVQDFYENHTHLTQDADFVVCRHTLEHIQPVQAFLQLIRTSMNAHAQTLLFFELPNVERVLNERAFWDIYYEHCSYFSLESLARLFSACGFEVLELYKDFGDQYLMLTARPADKSIVAAEDAAEQLAGEVTRFKETIPQVLEAWKRQLKQANAQGKRTVIWGAGSKGVAFLTTLGIRDEIAYAVDINPFKQGKFMPGTGHEVVAPGFLKAYRPDTVLIMNPVYLGEVRRDLQALGLDPELIPLDQNHALVGKP